MASSSATTMEARSPIGVRADVKPSVKLGVDGSATTYSSASKSENVQCSAHGPVGSGRTAPSENDVKSSPAIDESLPGKINIPQSPQPTMSARATAVPFYNEAIRAELHENTAEDIEINIFGDGSYQKQDDRAGCAIVWKRLAPASYDKSATMILAFNMPSGGDSHNAEAAALSLGFLTAKRELPLVIGSFIEANPSALETILKRPVSINIFTDNTKVMLALKNPKKMKGSALFRALIQECLAAAHDALVVPEFPGLVVKLSLSWVPAHKADFHIKLHDLADKAAKQARIRGECFRLSGVDAKEAPDFSKRVLISLDSGILKTLNHFALVSAPPPPPRANAPKKRRCTDEDDDDAQRKPPAKKLKVPPKLKASKKLKATGTPGTRTLAAGTHATAGRAATGSTDAPSSAGAAGALMVGASTASALFSVPDDDPRLVRMASRALLEPEFQRGAAILSDGISPRLFLTDVGFRIHVCKMRRAETEGEGGL